MRDNRPPLCQFQSTNKAMPGVLWRVYLNQQQVCDYQMIKEYALCAYLSIYLSILVVGVVIDE